MSDLSLATHFQEISAPYFDDFLPIAPPPLWLAADKTPAIGPKQSWPPRSWLSTRTHHHHRCWTIAANGRFWSPVSTFAAVFQVIFRHWRATSCESNHPDQFTSPRPNFWDHLWPLRGLDCHRWLCHIRWWFCQFLVVFKPTRGHDPLVTTTGTFPSSLPVDPNRQWPQPHCRRLHHFPMTSMLPAYCACLPNQSSHDHPALFAAVIVPPICSRVRASYPTQLTESPNSPRDSTRLSQLGLTHPTCSSWLCSTFMVIFYYFW